MSDPTSSPSESALPTEDSAVDSELERSTGSDSDESPSSIEPLSESSGAESGGPKSSGAGPEDTSEANEANEANEEVDATWEAMRTALRAQFDRLTAELYESESTANTLSTLVESLQSDNTALRAEVKVAEDLLTSVRGDLEASQQSQSDAVEAVRHQYTANLESQLEVWESEREESAAEIEELEGKIQALHDRLAEIAEDSGEIAVAEPVPEPTAPIRVPEAVRSGAATQKDTAPSTEAAAAPAVIAMGPPTGTPQALSSEEQDDLDALADRVRVLFGENVSLRERIAELEAELTEAQSHSATEFDETDDQIEALRQNLSSINARLGPLETERDQALDSLGEAEALAAAMQAQAREDRSRVEDLQAELTAKQTTLTAAEKRLVELHEASSRAILLEDQVDHLRTELERRKRFATENRERAIRLEEELEEREDSLSRFRRAAAARASRIELLEAELEKLLRRPPPLPPPPPPQAVGAKVDDERLTAARSALARAEGALREEVARSQAAESERTKLAAELEETRAEAARWKAEAESHQDELQRRFLNGDSGEISVIAAELTDPTEMAAIPVGVEVEAKPDPSDRLRAELQAATASIRQCILEIEHGRQRVDTHRQELSRHRSNMRTLIDLYVKVAPLAKACGDGSASESERSQLAALVVALRQPLRDLRSLLDSTEALSESEQALVRRMFDVLTRRPST